MPGRKTAQKGGKWLEDQVQQLARELGPAKTASSYYNEQHLSDVSSSVEVMEIY